MFYITYYPDFHDNYSPPPTVGYEITGKFLIVKEEQEQGMYFCDLAIVTKYNIDYYNDFTRVYLNKDILAKLKENNPQSSIKITSKNEFSILTQVISDESYYKLAANYNKLYAKRLLSQLFDLGVMRKKGLYTKDDDSTNRAKITLLSHNRSRYAYTKGVDFLFSRNNKDYIKSTSLNELLINLPETKKDNKLELKFFHNIIGRMPINIFIGKNGAGKSYSIEQIIKCYLKDGNQNLSENINKIIMISNTVKDNYPATNRALHSLRNRRSEPHTDDYEYFSTLRGKKYSVSDGFESFDFKTLINDMIKREIFEEIPFNALKVLENIIKDNINCSIGGLNDNNSSFKSLDELLSLAKYHYEFNDSSWPGASTIFLSRDGKELKLSSGQDNFILIISCILTSIQNNSLIFIDELENFLHPNFISQAMKILTQCLLETNSICIIATHSLHIAREIPKDGVTIFENPFNSNDIVIYNPDIESYSCNLQLMSNYIFNTKEESSIFDSTLHDIAKKYNNKKDLINDLIHKTSHEIILSIADRINEN
ncbi:MAG: AAA family ATPase [Citrobacter freundii]|nr:AAA family ATPase [Citrobacter freundii]